MAFNIARVAVRLVANTLEFQRGMRMAGRRLETFKRTAARVGKGIALAFTAAFGAILTSTARLNLKLNDLAVQLQRPVQEIQALASASREAGIDTETFIRVFRKISGVASQAANGSVEYQKAFAQLNIDAGKFQQLDLISQVKVLSARFRELGTDSAAMATKFKILEEDGQRFLLLLDSSPEQIDKYVKAAQRMGNVNVQAARGFELMRRTWERFKNQVGGLFTDLAGGFFAKVFPDQVGAKAVTQMNNLVKAEFELQEALEATALSAKKRNDILTGGTSSFGAAQINRASEFLSFKRQGAPQEIRSKQIETTNSLLRDIRSFVRNNTTGNTVTFAG